MDLREEKNDEIIQNRDESNQLDWMETAAFIMLANKQLRIEIYFEEDQIQIVFFLMKYRCCKW